MTASLQSAFMMWAMICRATGVLLQELRRNRAQWHQPQQEHPRYPSQFYTSQRLDHFGRSDNRTWSQRYFINFDHYQVGGPVFLYIGGEGPVAAKEVLDGNVLASFSQRTGGAVVALEHRFYGRSQPFDTTENKHLTYLTSRQALHDLAQFQQWFTASHSLEQSSWFCVGGSYPGNLAAWYRLEFPNMTAGCWSASAPVQAVEDWPGFGQMVWRAMATSVDGTRDDAVPVKLYAGYERMAALIQDSTPEAASWLKREFSVCPGSTITIAQDDRDSFENAISTAVGDVMQYNNTKEPKLTDIRRIVQQAETPLAAALQVSKFLNLTIGDGPANCSDHSLGAMYRRLADVSLPKHGNGNAERTWFWQTCNEFGYFQKGTASIDSPTMYTRGASNPSMHQNVCSEIFDVSASEVRSRIADTNAYYGAKSPRSISHVFFSNGDLDAWSLLGITSYPENNREVYARVAELGSHCVGMYPSKAGDIPDAAKVSEQAFQLFKRWDAAKPQKATMLFA